MPHAPHRLRVAHAATLCAALAFAGLASAQSERAVAGGAQAQQEREACLSGKSGQDQATCLREVGAAREAARKGNLQTEQGQLDRNRHDRCKSLAGAERADCHARMRGEGRVEGSVKGGGVIREKRTVIQGEAATTRPGGGTEGSGPASVGAGAGTGSGGAAPSTAPSSTGPASGPR